MNEALIVFWLTISNIFYSASPNIVRFDSNPQLDAAGIFGLTYCNPQEIDQFGYSGACRIILNDCIKYSPSLLKKVFIHELAHYANFKKNGLKATTQDGHGQLWQSIMSDWNQVVEAKSSEINWQCTYEFAVASQASRSQQ